MIPSINPTPTHLPVASKTKHPAGQVRFGAVAPDLGPVTNAARKFYRVIGNDPGLRILFLDLFAWCGIRTWIDYNRSWFLPDNLHRLVTGKPQSAEQAKEANQKNPAAGLERMMREVGCTFTDVFSSVAVLIPTLPIVDRVWGLYSSRFVTQHHLNYFKTVAEALAKKPEVYSLKNGTERLNAFYQEMASQLAGSMKLTPAQTQDLKQLLTAETLAKEFTHETGLKGFLNRHFHLNSPDMDKLMERIQTITGKSEFDVQLTEHLESSLPELLRDVSKIARRMERAAVPEGMTWAHYLVDRLEKTTKFRKWMPLALFISLAGNMLLPHIIQLVTLKKYATHRYPGELGIHKGAKMDFDNVSHHEKEMALKEHYAKPWYERSFPYFTEALSHGNVLPLLPALVLVPFMLGFYQISGSGVAGLSKPNSLLKQPLASLKYWFKRNMVLPEALSGKAMKNWLSKLSEKLDFSSRFPFCSDQQQATTYSTALFSRIVTPRSPIEWRERTFDSLLSYWIGFMFTPTIEGKLAKSMNEESGHWLGRVAKKFFGPKINLIKANGEIRSEYEILYGLKDNKEAQKATLKAKTWLNMGLLSFTAFLMGVFEPILSIYLTGLQSDWQSKKAKAVNGPMPLIQPQPIQVPPLQQAFQPALQALPQGYSSPFLPPVQPLPMERSRPVPILLHSVFKSFLPQIRG